MMAEKIKKDEDAQAQDAQKLSDEAMDGVAGGKKLAPSNPPTPVPTPPKVLKASQGT